MLRNIKLVVPGGPGNPVRKLEGQDWGATLRFEHQGGAIVVDCGWVCHFGAQFEGPAYYWATNQGVSILEHAVWFMVEVTVVHVQTWRSFGFPEDRKISAQACVCPEHALDIIGYDGITAPMADRLDEVQAYINKKWTDAYIIGQEIGEAQFRNLTIKSYS